MNCLAVIKYQKGNTLLYLFKNKSLRLQALIF